MEDLLLQSITKFNFAEILSLLLLLKGFNTLDKLTTSVNELSETVEKISGVNERLDKIEVKLNSFKL